MYESLKELVEEKDAEKKAAELRFRLEGDRLNKDLPRRIYDRLAEKLNPSLII